MPPVIRIENLSKSYLISHGRPRGQYRTLRETLGDLATAPWRRLRGLQNGRVEEFWALKDVNLDVQQGEVLGVIGRNGAGKSTLLKILSRITAPTTGRVELRGRVGSLLEVGTGFHPELTGRENVYLNGSILGMSRREIQRKFDEIVDFSGVEKFLDTPVKRYSSGMYVRLAFAVAAHLEPEILIVDEVLAVGDVAFQKKCIGKMQDVSTGGRTVLFVSHNMPAVATLCHKVAWMESGQVRECGPTWQVIEAYNASCQPTTLRPSESLHERPRSGSGAAQFTRMEVRPGRGSGADIREIFTGESLEITLEVASCRGIREANVAATLYDNSNYRIVDVNTALKGDFLTLGPGETAKVTFVLHELLLKPGTYTIELWLGRGGIEEIDLVRDAGRIDVREKLEEARHCETFPGTYQCRFAHTISR